MRGKDNRNKWTYFIRFWGHKVSLKKKTKSNPRLSHRGWNNKLIPKSIVSFTRKNSVPNEMQDFITGWIRFQIIRIIVLFVYVLQFKIYIFKYSTFFFFFVHKFYWKITIDPTLLYGIYFALADESECLLS